MIRERVRLYNSGFTVPLKETTSAAACDKKPAIVNAEGELQSKKRACTPVTRITIDWDRWSNNTITPGRYNQNRWDRWSNIIISWDCYRHPLTPLERCFARGRREGVSGTALGVSA